MIVTYRKDREFDDLKGLAGANAARLVGRRVDVTDETAMDQLTAGIAAEHRRLDVLVNTVGGYVGGINLWELDTRLFDQMLVLNLRSGYLLSRAAVKAMLQQAGGARVNAVSKAALDHRGERRG